MTSHPSPSDQADLRDVLAQRVGYLFAKLHQRWVGESVVVLRDAGLGLSGLHFGALSVVESAGPISQQTLGDLLGKDRTTVVAIVDELEAESLIERRRNPDDRRAYALEVTAKGHGWLDRARPVLHAAEDDLLAALSADEREALLEMLQRTLFSTSLAD
ncbi:MAG: MarR family transcriptional regulator [Solirubrobacterales bacterium]|nr:MarR family transcriptional regulator [Solirubrobacterales bacterium]